MNLAIAAKVPDVTDSHSNREWSLIAGIAMCSGLLMIGNMAEWIDDPNFVHLWEAVSLLRGDDIYRELFEWGAPAAAYLSAAFQILVGYRLIGEFLVHYLFTLVGLALAVSLGLRVSRSAGAVMLAAIPTLLVVTAASYHSSKLFFFPLGLWLACRYVERPSTGRAALFGTVTAIAFLWRHDYLLYLMALAMFALCLAAWTAGDWRRRGREAIVGAAAAWLCVTPWLFVVSAREGLNQYVALRVAKNEGSPSLVRHFDDFNPIRALSPAPLPLPKPGIVGFEWQPDTDAGTKARLLATLALEPLGETDGSGRLRFRAANLYEPSLLTLDPYIRNGAGFEWDVLKEAVAGLPARHGVIRWLAQAAILIPIIVILNVAWHVLRSISRRIRPPVTTLQAGMGAAFLLVVDHYLFREPSYMVTVAPLTFQLSSWLMRPVAMETKTSGGQRIGFALRTTLFVVILGASSYAAFVWGHGTPIYDPFSIPHSVREAWRDLVASPPAMRRPEFDVFRRCTVPSDHVLVTGSTPFTFPYYSERAVAGGHLYWHSRWGVDEVTEMRSLRLLLRQSVPFVVSTGDTIAEEFRPYPRILAHLQRHYREVPGTDGHLWVDARRTPSHIDSPSGLPCFR